MSKFALGYTARVDLSDALEKIAMAVGSTMGPGGRSFGFDKRGTDMRFSSTFSKDGLTTLRALHFPGDPVSQAVLQYCGQSASHSVLASGDGTSSTIILANAVAKAVNKAEGGSACKWPQALARELEKDAAKAVSAIRKEAIKGEETVKKVALTSTNGDEELSDIVIKSVKMSSAFGSLLTVKVPASRERYKIGYQDGYSNCKGYDYNSTFATSASPMASSSKAIEWDNPYVVIFNGSLMVESQVNPILQAWNSACTVRPSNLVIVAYDVGDQVINKLLVMNRKLAKQGLAAFVVKPRLSAEINAGLQVARDIASFCGISEDHIVDGGNYQDVKAVFFGQCKTVKITPMSSMFLGRGEKHWVDIRIMQNQSIADESRSEFDSQIASIRNAELAEGLVKIEIGGGLLPDLDEREARFDDASKAAQACMRSGALPGCGLSYIRAAKIAAVHPALEESFRSIYETVAVNYGMPVDNELFPGVGHGISLSKEGVVYGNAFDLSVLDATETICSVIENGVQLGVRIATMGGYIYKEKINDE